MIFSEDVVSELEKGIDIPLKLKEYTNVMDRLDRDLAFVIELFRDNKPREIPWGGRKIGSFDKIGPAEDSNQKKCDGELRRRVRQMGRESTWLCETLTSKLRKAEVLRPGIPHG